jgi:cell division protein FtsL|tara:strand:+ start:102 stop:380 length:279 start_codon:yes stop_codon:yes gene_type:complete
MSNITKDDLWKVLSLMMSALVLPLAGWVWSTNVKVAELQNDLGDAEETISVLEKKILGADDNSKQIIGMEKDIEYMMHSLGRIEDMVTRKKE